MVDTDQGVDRRGAARPRHDELSPGAGDRKGTGQDLLRAAKRSRRASTRRSSGSTPATSSRRSPRRSCRPRSADPRELRRAEEVFRDDSPKSFLIDLGDLSRDAWSLLPARGDFLAEIHTRRFDTLTYAQVRRSEAEDITSSIASAITTSRSTRRSRRCATRGRFYNEDDLVDYDILDYDIDVAISPGSAMDRRPRAPAPQSAGRSRSAAHAAARRIARRPVDRQRRARTAVRHPRQEPEHDRRQPADDAAAGRGGDADDHLRRAGSSRRRRIAKRWRWQQASRRRTTCRSIAAEPSFLYSNRSYWYPQAPVSDYATATHPHHRCRRRSTAWPAASWSPDSRDCSSPAKDPAHEPQGLPVPRRRSRCAIWRSSSAGSRAPKRPPIAFPPASRTRSGMRAARRPVRTAA